MDIIKWIDTIGVLSFSVYCLLIFITTYTATNHLTIFFLTIYLQWILLFFLFYILQMQYSKNTYHQNKIQWKIMLWGLLFQLPAFFCTSILDDDFYRYLWDGYVFATMGTPYQTVPANFFNYVLPEQITEILNRTSYPHVKTIYGPICEYLFLLANYFIPYQLIIIKFALMIATVSSTYLISKMIHFRYLLLFAWCPLLILETGYEVHIEIISLCFVIFAIYLTYLNHSSIKKNIFTIFFSSAAIAAKFFALPIVIIILMKHQVKYWILFFALLFIFYLPFIFNGSDINTLPSVLLHWQFNASLFEVINYFLGFFYSKIFCMTLFTVTFLIIIRQTAIEQFLIPRGDIIYGFLFLLSPVVNPWYFLWLLLFAVIYPRLWIWTALITVSLSYLNGFYLSDWSIQPYMVPLPILLIEYGTILVAFLIDTHFLKQNYSMI